MVKKKYQQNNFTFYSLKKTSVVFICLTAFVVGMAMIPAKLEKTARYHTSDELVRFQQRITSPIEPGEYFLTPDRCEGCHGFDTLHLANIDLNGNDVNLFDDWETSMMGLAGVDPLWRAKVSHEMLTNPGHANELQTFCTSCHAPMGHYTALYKHQPYYTLADLETDSLGIAGVACNSCHSIGTDSLGQLFSGNIPYDTNRVEYGPFDDPMQGPMQLYVGLTPVKSAHVSEGRMCSSCHTLISNVVDLNGNPTGASFVEQSTYHEWENSIYPTQMTVCQTCHMPQIEDPIKIANGYTALPGRSPFNLHQFSGANYFMVNLIKNNKEALGVTAPDANFDSTLAAINVQLTQNSLKVKVINDTVLNDTAYINIALTNKAGHKFPSGYPSRRAVLQFVVIKSTGDTLFASGLFDTNQEVINIDPVFENHYNIINNPAQVQIYEMVMGDVNGDKTTVLERSASKLKDNRIPPKGFTTQHYTYDTCFIAGNALTDPDFNKNGIVEGTGMDTVHFHVPLNGYSGIVNISAAVYYQAVPPSWLTEMFAYNSAQIDTFRQMFNTADKSPLLVSRDSLENILIPTGIDIQAAGIQLNVTPNPTFTGKILISGEAVSSIKEIKVYNSLGEDFKLYVKTPAKNSIQIQLPASPGIYVIVIATSKGPVIKKILRL